MRNGLLSRIACTLMLLVAAWAAVPLHAGIRLARATDAAPATRVPPISVLRLPRFTLFDVALTTQRAVLFGTQDQKQAQAFLVYDPRTDHLLLRTPVPPALAAAVPGALHLVDEARHRAYFLYGNRRHSATILWAIDLNSGRVAFRRGIAGGVPTGTPALGSDGKTLCYPEYGAVHGYHIVIVDLQKKTGVRRVGLGLQPNLLDLFVDSRARLVIAISWASRGAGVPIQVASYNLGSGKLIWQVTRMFRIFPRQYIFDAQTQTLYSVDLAALSIVHTANGHAGVVKYQEQGAALGSLLVVPGAGLYLSWSTSSAARIDLLSAGKPFHVTAASLNAGQFPRLDKGATAAGTTPLLIALRRNPRGLLGYYLGSAMTPSGQAVLTPSSMLTLFDWRQGRVLSRQPLPVAGVVRNQDVEGDTIALVLQTGARAGLPGAVLLTVRLPAAG